MKPTRLGPQRSFGFGDRFGLAGSAAVEALAGSAFVPILAQQSPRELAATGRTPAEVLAAICPGADPLGADADAVTTADEARSFIAAGFTRLTIDPSAYFVERAASFSADELQAGGQALIEDGVFAADWSDLFPERELPLPNAPRFSDDDLFRTAVKFGWSLAFAAELVAESGANALEIEFSLAGANGATSPLEHWFIARECRHRGLLLVAIAPRLPGSWEAVADCDAEPAVLESALRDHTALATLGSHQLSFSGIEAKESLWPLLGRICRERLHVKTSALSSLAAMRIVARREASTFRELLTLAQERFAFAERRNISLSEDEIRFLPDVVDDALEAIYLDDVRGRQFLEVTIPSLWGDGLFADGCAVRERLTGLLATGEYQDLMRAEIRKILYALRTG